MLKKLSVENFLSWINLQFEPAGESLIIGTNNSGKTNLCRALQFLRNSAWTKLDECAERLLIPKTLLTNHSYSKKTVNFKLDVFLDVDSQPVHFVYELEIAAATGAPNDSSVLVNREQLSSISEGQKVDILISNEQGNVTLHHEKDPSRSVETKAPLESTMLSRLYELDTNHKAIAFRNYLRSWQYYYLSDSELRKSEHRRDQIIISTSGENLASVIYNLKKTDERSYRKLLELLKNVEPGLEYINFIGGDIDPVVLMKFQYEDDFELPAFTSSPGTLRFIALAYILAIQKRSYTDLIIIEEPENGLHVDLLKTILELPRTTETSQPQLIYTTHSPYFIDYFEDMLEGVFVTKKDSHRSTLHPIDKRRIEEFLKDFSLGDLHFKKLLS